MQKTSEAKRLGTEVQLKAETQIALDKKEKELEATVKKVAEAQKYKEQQEDDANRYAIIKKAEAYK